MRNTGEVEVRLPYMGVSVAEATLVGWHKAVGDHVEEGDPLCDVGTDKADTEVEAPATGTLAALMVDVGETIDVDVVIATIRTTRPSPDVAGGQNIPTPAAPPEEVVARDERPVSTSTKPGPSAARHAVTADVSARPFDHSAAAREVAARVPASGRVPASPLARTSAALHGIALEGVEGTGLGRRIRNEDVLAAVAPRRAAPVSLPSLPTSADSDTGVPRGYEDVPYVAVPTSRVRRVIAEHMMRSRQTAAHMTTEVEVDVTPLTEVRAAVNADRNRRGQPKVSFLPFLLRVACAVLQDHRNLNATFEMDRFLQWEPVNVGVAIDTDRGLVVPVVRNCHELTVEAISSRIADLAGKARAGKLTADELRAGTFTISNPGSVGATSAMAIINQPQVAILGVPVIVRRPWVLTTSDGEEVITVRSILNLTLTFDHRAVDGADATRALVQMKQCLEAWSEGHYR
jgi:2-oxoglutarate dehydrogenase E2 component (dihydrolipoamide succinyltransferase)